MGIETFMDKLIAHSILTKLLLILWTLVTSPLWFPLVWLAKKFNEHDEHEVLAGTICVILLAFFAGLYWLSKKMSYHMTIEGEPFGKSVKAGLLDARLHLAFLPLVGHWFMAKPDKRDNDDAPPNPGLRQ
jgi:hypothetical protein